MTVQPEKSIWEEMQVALDEYKEKLRAEQFEAVLFHLNLAYQHDPVAIHTLVCNRVPCNTTLMQHPTVVVESRYPADQAGYTVGALGLLNAALTAAKLPRVAAMFSDSEQGEAKLLGFVKYTPTEAAG